MKAINEAVAAGVYEEKTVERKTPQGTKVTIKMVKVVEEQEEESHDQQYREKARAGRKMDVEEFVDTVGDMIAPDDDDEPIMKRPASKKSCAAGLAGPGGRWGGWGEVNQIDETSCSANVVGGQEAASCMLFRPTH